MPTVNFERPVRQEPPVSLRLDKQTLQSLDDIAARNGKCSRASLLRRAIQEFITQHWEAIHHE